MYVRCRYCGWDWTQSPIEDDTETIAVDCPMCNAFYEVCVPQDEPRDYAPYDEIGG